VHRALLGEQLPAAELDAIGKHVSAAERRATAAERAALDRYRAQLYAGRIGQSFTGRVNGVARFGLFVTLAESGTDGLLPIANLPPDFYRFDSARLRLSGRHSRRSFGLGDTVDVRLAEADPLGGRLIFRLNDSGSDPPRFVSKRRRGKSARSH
jgi:ribonuclease R